ncbi:MAG: adenosyl-hopene transferase HpnH, partial [Terracidiphilus sp.]
PKCANCMVSCGYEPTAVMDGFGSLSGFWAMIRGTFSSYPDEHALRLLNEPAPRGPATLVKIENAERVCEETRV